jgi:hypothetical protein
MKSSKRKAIQLYIDPAPYKLFKRWCKKKGLPVSAWLRAEILKVVGPTK